MKKRILLLAILFSLMSCVKIENQEKMALQPDIFPDYKSVTIPPNIAPLTFTVKGAKRLVADFLVGDSVAFRAFGDGKKGIKIPEKPWKALLAETAGRSFEVRVFVESFDKKWQEFLPFDVFVASDSIDAYVSYRLIKPDYEQADRMGLYQRDITTFDEKTIIENLQLNSKDKFGCVNCHSYCNYNADTMMYHARFVDVGTVVVKGDEAKKLNLTMKDMGKGTYPAWHPSAAYIAFSMNETMQVFHVFDDNRISVYDTKSDLMLYDVEKKEAIVDKRFLNSPELETFPSWSPDGEFLYFSSAKMSAEIPLNNDEIRYGIYRIRFDEKTATFGDSVECIVDADVTHKTQLFARVSPDNRYLLYTEADYGTFPIWHHEADLGMIDLQNGKHVDMSALNSASTESYHAWSSNGRWIVFSSRRIDGLYTRLYFAYFDKNGIVHKPFLMPQKTADFDLLRMKSYNVPEFSKNAVRRSKRQMRQIQAEAAEPVKVRYQ